jgi:hypothetical protein
MAEIETVKVKSGDSFATINKEDFDAGKHEIFVDATEPENTSEPLKPKKKGKK